MMVIKDIDNLTLATRSVIKIEVGECIYKITELPRGKIQIQTIAKMIIEPRTSNLVIIEEVDYS